MKPLRDLYWLHYEGSGPKATLWDEWLSLAAFWPAVEDRGLSDHMRKSWSEALSARILDADGYLATHQHASIAHQLGWPFPFYIQGQGGFGWHYSFRNTVDANWRPRDLNTPGDWLLTGAKDGGTNQDGWRIEFTAPGAFAAPPIREVDPYNAPFAQLRWSATGLEAARPFIPNDETGKGFGVLSGTAHVFRAGLKGNNLHDGPSIPASRMGRADYRDTDRFRQSSRFGWGDHPGVLREL